MLHQLKDYKPHTEQEGIKLKSLAIKILLNKLSHLTQTTLLLNFQT